MGSKFRQYRKWILSGLFLLALTVGGAIYFTKSSNVALNEPTMIVGRGDVKASVSATGTVKAVNSVDVSSRVTGLITEVRVQENDMVKKGQVLVVLDDSVAREQVAQYEAQVANYAAVYERTRKIAAIGGLSLQQLDADRTNYLVAKANRDNYAAQMAYYIITAPSDGMVVGTPASVGATIVQGISAAQTILTIVDMSKLQVKTLVDETDIGKLKVGQLVSFTVDAYADKKFSGKVTRISREATTSSNVIYYPVYVTIDDSENLLYPNMTARVILSVAERLNVLIVPLTAIKEEKGQKYVQAMVNGKVENLVVQTGLRDDDNVEIVNGLTAGTQIVIPAAKATSVKQDQGPPPPM